MAAEQLITRHLDLWAAAIKRRSTAGRGSSSKVELYGIKKLRELILELAVRGLLVPQDPQDEPASELLKRIAAEKAKLVKEGKIKKQKPLPPIGENEKSFGLPKNWEWARITDLSELITSGSRDWAQYLSDEGALFVTMGNLSRGSYELRLDNLRFVKPPSNGEGNRTRLEAHDLLISITGDVGNLGRIPENFGEAYINQHTCLVRFLPSCRGRYFPEALRSPLASLQFNEPQRGVKNSFRLSDVDTITIPLPPLAEQHRIVAKVDELMALCDQLEQQTDASLSAHQTLVETLLNALTSATDHAQFASSWQRIAEHFDTLFTTEESIDQLKQTLLQLAVMGKLVPQDPKDEPASELLKKIAAEKAKLVKEGKIKKDKPQPSITDQEKPFEAPTGWILIRFGDLLINRDSERIPLSVDERATRRGDYDYYGASGVIDSIDDYLFDKPLLLIGEDGANLINRSTPIAFMARGKYWVNNHAHVLDGYSEDLLLYVCLYINAISLEPYVTGTAQPKMNQAKMNGIVLAIPPLAEQHRIVAKVDELMELCDQLKARLSDAQVTQLNLADALTEKALVGA